MPETKILSNLVLKNEFPVNLEEPNQSPPLQMKLVTISIGYKATKIPMEFQICAQDRKIEVGDWCNKGSNKYQSKLEVERWKMLNGQLRIVVEELRFV